MAKDTCNKRRIGSRDNFMQDVAIFKYAIGDIQAGMVRIEKKLQYIKRTVFDRINQQELYIGGRKLHFRIPENCFRRSKILHIFFFFNINVNKR